MLAVLFFLALLFLVIVFYELYNCWRRSFLAAALVCGVFIVVSTEILSWFSWFSLIPVASSWLLLNGILLFIIAKNKSYSKFLDLLSKSVYLTKRNLSWFLNSLLIGIIAIALIVGLIAIVAPPNTWDSMTYHMSRVVHWLQNETVAHYPTYNLPQLFHPPFAEFVIAHLQILSNSDRLANLVQWFSGVGSVIGVSLIARELKANLRGQVFAAVFCATIPMGILQASSTQNDYVVSFWLVCLAYYVLLAIKSNRQPIIFWFIGISLGLGILTKSSAYLYGFPFMVWLSLVQLNRFNWRWRGWQTMGLTTAIAFLLNVGHYGRNLNLFGSPLGTPENFAVAYKIEVFSLPTFISNVLRNMALHLDIVRNLGLQRFITPITGIGNKLLLIIHDLLGVDMYDPRITASSYGGVPGLSFDENVAGNPLHFFILLSAIAYFLLSKQLRRDRRLLIYTLATVCCFGLLCLVLKIQAYQSRHHLAIFILFAPLVGIVLSQLRTKTIANLVAIMLIVASLPWVLQNKFRPIAAEANIFNLSRVEQYFINRPQLQIPYQQAAEFIQSTGCQNVGLSLGDGTSVGNEYWEYPFWILLNNAQPKIRLENVAAQNVSLSKTRSEPFNDFIPCAILAVRNQKDKPVTEMKLNNMVYTKKLSVSPVTVLIEK